MMTNSGFPAVTRLFIWVPFALVLFFCNGASAEELPVDYQLHLGTDIGVTAISSAIWLGSTIADRHLSLQGCEGICDPAPLNPLDRKVVNNDSAGLRVVANVGVGLILGGAVVGTLLKIRNDRLRDVVEEWFIFTETIVVTGAITSLVKHAVQRPRPYMYNPNVAEGYRRGHAGDTLSFYSAHTALAFSAAAAFSRMYAKTRPNSRVRWLIYALTFGCAAGVASARVGSGDHFWTDVFAGALVGTALGVAVPALHETRHKNVDVGVSVVGSGVAVTGQF